MKSPKKRCNPPLQTLGDRSLFLSIGKRAIAVYFCQLEKARSEFICVNGKERDRFKKG